LIQASGLHVGLKLLGQPWGQPCLDLALSTPGISAASVFAQALELLQDWIGHGLRGVTTLPQVVLRSMMSKAIRNSALRFCSWAQATYL
jgi:hypothetical protein